MNPSFSRTALVLGDAAIDRLQAAHVAVLGLGGVGGYAAEALARAGVGELTLIDEDVIGPTNLNRQLLATVDAIGQPKADAATARAAAINPDCTLHPLRFRYEAAAREEFFAVRYDYIVDAIDLVSCKLDLIETAHDLRPGHRRQAGRLRLCHHRHRQDPGLPPGPGPSQGAEKPGRHPPQGGLLPRAAPQGGSRRP